MKWMGYVKLATLAGTDRLQYISFIHGELQEVIGSLAKKWQIFIVNYKNPIEIN